MKSTLLLSVLLVCMVLVDNTRHKLKKAMKTGITSRKSQLKVKKVGLKVKKMSMKMKAEMKMRARTMAKVRQLGGMEEEKTQRVYRDKAGNCIWGDLQRRVSQYPTIIRDHFRAKGPDCSANEDGQSSCRTLDNVLDLAAKSACKVPIQENTESVYYVNTRRQQGTDIFNVNEDYLNQFTFVVLPSSKDAITEDYEPKLFSVIVPSKLSVEPYVLDKCPFDFSMDKDKDVANNASNDCYFNIAKGTKVVLKYHESEDFKKFQQEKEKLAMGGLKME